MLCACAILSFGTCPAVPYFSTLSQTARFSKKKKVIERKICVLIFSTTLKHFSFQEELSEL
jgi:hypothetical protein